VSSCGTKSCQLAASSEGQGSVSLRAGTFGAICRCSREFHLCQSVVPCAGTAEKVELPEDFFATTWASLKDFISAVHALRFTEHSFEQLYGVRVPHGTPALHADRRAPAQLSSRVRVVRSTVCVAALRAPSPQSVTNLVLAKRGPELYANVVAELDAHVARLLDAEAGRGGTVAQVRR
jgi:hypothetical protein